MKSGFGHAYALIRVMLFWVLFGGFAPGARGQPADSLHIRQADSTRVVLDTETVPAAIRSRMHELTVLHPPGFFPREETASTGFWESRMAPQYGTTLQVYDHEIRTRLRPAVPLRYLVEHAIAGIRFDLWPEEHYPLRTHILERKEEPVVNVVYKKGDFGLSALSVDAATDLSPATHLHLAREGERYAGLYGVDGIRNERYYLALHHQISDSTTLFYSTFYARDNLGWTDAVPDVQVLGSESSSWYHHLMEWRTTGDRITARAGLNLGSQRLWLTRTGEQQELMELQRGGWLALGLPAGRRLQGDLTYRFDLFQMQSAASQLTSEPWHRLTFTPGYAGTSWQVNGRAEVLARRSPAGWQRFFLPGLRAVWQPLSRVSLRAGYRRTVRFPAWQWTQSDTYLQNAGDIGAATHLRRGEVGIHYAPVDWGSVEVSAEYLWFRDWYRLTQQAALGVVDGALSAEKFTGHFPGGHARLTLHPWSWLAAGGRYDLYPSLPVPLPEVWSRQMVTGWLHVQRFFFQHNLLAHVYAEGGALLSRLSTGWQPILQSVVYYPRVQHPGPAFFAHLYFIGEVGPFTISASFYNSLAYNLRYAVDQRPQSPLFFLSVRWQFWD